MTSNISANVLAASSSSDPIVATNEILSKADQSGTLSWTVGFCNDFAPLALFMAQLFLYLGLAMGVAMAAAEAYKLYRDAIAVKPAAAEGGAAGVARNTAVGEVIKSLVGVLTGAKAWLALVIVGVLLLWLAGNSVPEFCKPS